MGGGQGFNNALNCSSILNAYSNKIELIGYPDERWNMPRLVFIDGDESDPNNYGMNHRLIQYLAFAEDLIRKHFPSVDRISSSIEYNPETNDKWVSIDVEVTGDMNQVIEWEGSFVKEWVASVPYPERNKIRLSCDII
jgi:hypothetical protein